MPWGMLASAVIGAFSSAKSSSAAKKAADNQYWSVTGQQNSLMGRLRLLYGIAGQDQDRAVGAIEEGYDAALDEVSRVGDASRTRILEREGQGLAAANATMGARGLGNTTLAESARRGVASDTNRALMDLDEMLSGLRVGVRTAGANAKATAYQNRAGFLAGQAGAETSAAQNYQALISDQAIVPGGGIGGSIGAALPYLQGVDWSKLFGKKTGGGAGSNLILPGGN